MTTASNAAKVLKNKQSHSSVKYLSPNFERFQTMTLPAKQKVEYYKLHKSLYDSKTD